MALVKHNNNSISAVTSMASLSTGAIVLISEQTASSSASVSFTTGIDSTYPIYKFEFINIHGANDGAQFQVGFRDGDTNYDATKTSTYFKSQNREDGNGGSLGYETSLDLAQGTGFQNLNQDLGYDNDQSLSGNLYLFNPASTTFVKHYIAECSSYASDNRAYNTFAAGYCNVTVAIDAVQFKMSSSNIDSGTIKMYGIKDS
jgi:hypothetical protein